jgi:glycosyltransferase involved in cell wall biosynthesis
MTSNPPKISLCIVTYRRDDDLMKSLVHLEESTFKDFEILIVDNGGSHELPGRLERSGVSRSLRLFQAPENRGCANLNLLFPEARGEVIACFDDDSYPSADCLEKTWKVFQDHPDIGMIGFKMHLPETGEPWHDPWWNPDSTEPRATVLCPGCGLAFRNDPRLPAELCIPDIVSQAHELSMAAEIARLGYKIEFRPECVAYHPDTTTGYSGAKAEAGSRNQLRFLLRYADPTTLQLLILTHWLARARSLPHQREFIREYLQETERRPLSRSTMGRFREVLLWHIHPWLRLLIPS